MFSTIWYWLQVLYYAVKVWIRPPYGDPELRDWGLAWELGQIIVGGTGSMEG